MGAQEFYKTNEEFCAELGCGEYEFKAAKKRLLDQKLVKIAKRGVPAKTYYVLNEELIFTRLTSKGKNPQLDGGKTPNWMGEKPPSLYGSTENTTETTTETNLSEAQAPTPSQLATMFFTSEGMQGDVALAVSEKRNVPVAAVRLEVNKFVAYWTELNKSGTKQRWQIEKTFEVQRRLATWFNNVRTFAGPVANGNAGKKYE